MAELLALSIRLEEINQQFKDYKPHWVPYVLLDDEKVKLLEAYNELEQYRSYLSKYNSRNGGYVSVFEKIWTLCVGLLGLIRQHLNVIRERICLFFEESDSD